MNKPQKPSMCLMVKNGIKRSYRCEAKTIHSQRLCTGYTPGMEAECMHRDNNPRNEGFGIKCKWDSPS